MYKTRADAVKEWLEAYRKEEEELDGIIERIRELRAGMMGVQAQVLSFLPKGPGSDDPMTDYVIRLESMEGDMRRRLDAHERDRMALKGLVDLVLRGDDWFVITHRYLFSEKWADIRYALYGQEPEYSKNLDKYDMRVFRAHKEALEVMARNWEIKQP